MRSWNRHGSLADTSSENSWLTSSRLSRSDGLLATRRDSKLSLQLVSFSKFWESENSMALSVKPIWLLKWRPLPKSRFTHSCLWCILTSSAASCGTSSKLTIFGWLQLTLVIFARECKTPGTFKASKATHRRSWALAQISTFSYSSGFRCGITQPWLLCWSK